MTLILAILRYNDLMAASLGISLNLLLLFLIFTVNKTKVQQMTRTLLQNCLLDLFLSTMTFFAGIQVTVINQICYLIIGSPFYILGFKAASILMVTYGSSLILSIQAMPVPFYIRYLVICKNRNVTNKHVRIPYLIVFSFFVIIYGTLFWTYPPDAVHYEKYRLATMTEFWTNEYPNGPVFVAAETHSISMLIPLSIILLTTTVSYILVMFYSYKITSKLNNHATLFRHTKIMHKQLNLTLIVQAIGPLITGNIPVVCLLVMILFNIQSPYPLLCCSFLLGWVSCVSPLAAIIIITPYRKRIKQILRLNAFPTASTMMVTVIK